MEDLISALSSLKIDGKHRPEDDHKNEKICDGEFFTLENIIENLIDNITTPTTRLYEDFVVYIRSRCRDEKIDFSFEDKFNTGKTNEEKKDVEMGCPFLKPIFKEDPIDSGIILFDKITDNFYHNNFIGNENDLHAIIGFTKKQDLITHCIQDLKEHKKVLLHMFSNLMDYTENIIGLSKSIVYKKLLISSIDIMKMRFQICEQKASTSNLCIPFIDIEKNDERHMFNKLLTNIIQQKQDNSHVVIPKTSENSAYCFGIFNDIYKKYLIQLSYTTIKSVFFKLESPIVRAVREIIEHDIRNTERFGLIPNLSTTSVLNDHMMMDYNIFIGWHLTAIPIIQIYPEDLDAQMIEKIFTEVMRCKTPDNYDDFVRNIPDEKKQKQQESNKRSCSKYRTNQKMAHLRKKVLHENYVKQNEMLKKTIEEFGQEILKLRRLIN